MKYKAALFDMDGVILNTEPIHVAAFQTTLADYGHSLSDDDYKIYFAGRTDEAGLKRYFDFVNEQANISVVLDQKSDKYIELAADKIIPYPNIVSLIRELSIQVPLVLVTSSSRIEADFALKACGISSCFKKIIAAGDVEHSKPDPEGYLKAVSILDLKANDCVVVEDSPSGIQAAIAAGIDCIAVTNTHSRNELKEATIIVDDLSLETF